ncbi:glycosyltransferase family 4 protein [Geminicoccus roseus]|uniref:glycosyltransferase family 4 protein n=1 Tax=Geminicoccus roseus TaxID=404900 RepID=UPI0004035EE4|nr:glycosyltransferase family 4 protein [Geminicoccus roseus]
MITLDAVGGVWRYAMDLAIGLESESIRTLLVGAGPEPDQKRRAECARAGIELAWTDAPLDWLAADAAALDRVPATLERIAREWQADLLHLNLPSQAAGLRADLPVVVASHSCVATWWAAVRGSELPSAWRWQHRLNRAGFARAEVVLAPSRSHGAALECAYGPLRRLAVVHNATAVTPLPSGKNEMVLSAGRWWDEGKNGRVLDEASAAIAWPVVMAGALEGPNGERIAFRHAHAPGELPSSEMQALMRKAAIFAAPSRYEPFGLAVLEAAANGAALVLADIPTFREIWNGVALFVRPDDPNAYAEAIRQLAGDPPLRWNLAEEARCRSRCFTAHGQLNGILQAYGTAMLRHVPADTGDHRS